jgi:hypothetical protein
VDEIGLSLSSGTSTGKKFGLEAELRHRKPSDAIYPQRKPRKSPSIPKAALATLSGAIAARRRRYDTGRFWQLSTGMHVPDRLKLAEHSYDADHDQAECDFNSGKDTKEAHGLIPAAAEQQWCEPRSIYASEP